MRPLEPRYRTRLIYALRHTATLLTICAVVLAVQSCTTKLTATKVGEPTQDEPNNKEVIGQVYYLPRTSFTVELDRELQKCEVGDKESTILHWLVEQVVPLNCLSSASFDNDDLQTIRSILSSNSTGPTLNKGERIELGRKINNYKNKPSLKADVQVAMKATITPVHLTDPEHAYAIRYEDMSDGTKSTDYSVETYPNGTLKSINVTLDDQTGEIAQSTISGALKIAAAASGFPIISPNINGGAGEENKKKCNGISVESYDTWLEKKIQLCNADVRLALNEKDDLDVSYKKVAGNQLTQRGNVAEKMAEIVQLEKKIADDGARLEELMVADNDTLTEVEVGELRDLPGNILKAKGDLRKKNEELAGLNETLAKTLKESEKLKKDRAKIRKSLTITTVTDFRPDNDTLTVDLGGIEEVRNKWMNVEVMKEYCSKNSGECGVADNDTLNVFYAQAALSPTISKLAQTTPPTKNFLVYRQPVRSPLWICKEQKCFDNDNNFQAEAKNVLFTANVDVPQLGVLASLPLTNYPFQNNALTASFAETGALTKLTYVTNAAVAKAAEAFNQSVDAYTEYRKEKLNEDKLELERAKSESELRKQLLEAQLEEEKAQDALDEYRAENAAE
jgi:hypothetical protein